MNPITFIHQVREELAKVTWPSRKETLNMTLIVLGVSVAVGLYVGGLDAVFTSLFDYIIKR
ncbi:MAG: preprotein translocase subunit SecE [Candidatus Pacebacteria bacterium]|nr:preprotein translocase subunit SecE [Candidatus Paceibacterota bacterium]